MATKPQKSQRVRGWGRGPAGIFCGLLGNDGVCPRMDAELGLGAPRGEGGILTTRAETSGPISVGDALRFRYNFALMPRGV
jgi:hypothetical protein